MFEIIKNMTIISMAIFLPSAVVLIALEVIGLRNWRHIRKTKERIKLFSTKQRNLLIIMFLVFSLSAEFATTGIVKLYEMPAYEEIGKILFILTRPFGIAQIIAIVLIVKNETIRIEK